MRRIIVALLVFVPTTFLTSCTITESAYYPAGIVYTTGYYGYTPYWSNFYGGHWGSLWRGYRGGSLQSWDGFQVGGGGGGWHSR
jgi:hypothetical protein